MSKGSATLSERQGVSRTFVDTLFFVAKGAARRCDATVMPVIDAHVHLYPPELNAEPRGWAEARGEAHWATLCTRTRKDGRGVQGFPSVTELLKRMDEAGVERAVLQAWYWEKPETCRWHNDFYAACLREHPDRLRAFAALHPAMGRDGAWREVSKAVERGFSGFGELSPHSQGAAALGEPWLEVMDIAAGAGLPFNFHVSENEGPAYPGRVLTPLEDFVALAKRYPKTPFILSHLGGRLPLLQTEAAALDNVYYDLAALPLTYRDDTLEKCLAAVGAGRLLFGTDYPLHLYPKETDTPELGRWLAEARRRISGFEAVAGTNAQSLGL